MRRAAPLAALLWLAACGAGRTTPREVTLRVVNWAPDLELLLEQRIAHRFEEGHPGVRVIVESVAANFGEKLVTAIVSGAPPDVFLLDVPDIPAFVDRGLVLDLAPYAGRIGYDTRADALPKDFTPMVVLYNRTLFRRLGVADPPGDGWSWAQFEGTCRELVREAAADGSPGVYAVDLPRNLYEWIPFVWSGGGDILDPTGSRASGWLDSPQTVAAFAFLAGLVETWHVAPPVQFLRTGDPSRMGRFYSGRQAMVVSGHWALPTILKYAERGRLDVAIAPIPHREGEKTVTPIYVSGWAVPANVRHKRLAVELAGFLAGPEAQRIRAETRLGIPALRPVAEARAAADPTGVETAFLAQAQRGRMPWGAVVRDFHKVEELSFDVMDRHLLRGEDLGSAAREVAREIDAALAR